MKNDSRRRYAVIISFALSLCALFSGGAIASLPNKELNIPAQFGAVKESFTPAGAGQNAGCTIIHIQDAHCNYEAQKNMAQILDYLVKERHLRLIMVEGGSGDVSLNFLRAYADRKTREEVADRYLKQGKISGEEYLDITSDYNLELYGIEDEELYDTHLAAFFKVDSIKEEALKYLGSLSSIVEALKPHIYSPELRELEAKKKDYEAKSLALADYCRFLKEQAQAKGLDPGDYSQIAAFAETAQLEKEVDFKSAESERNEFIKVLAKFIDEARLKQLVDKSQAFKAAKISALEYYSFLNEATGRMFNLKEDYPHFYSYTRYLTVSKEVNAADLLKEAGEAEEKLKEACFTGADQRRLNEIDKSLNILVSLLNLELTPEDYGYFKANRSKFATNSWVDYLGRNCAQYNLALYPAASTVIEDNLFKLNEFYQMGSEREDAFIKNITNKMSVSGEKVAALITGGFHTPGLTQKLKSEGYSYAVVTPTITQKGDSSIYFSVLKGERKPPSKADYMEDEE